MQKLYKIKVDISKKYAMPAFEVNTNDLKSIRLSIEVLNGSSPLDLSDKTVRIAIRKPDNNIVFQDCEVKDAASGQVEVILENQAYITPGTHTAEIMCYKGSEVVAVTGTFSYKSTKGIMNDEAVESKSEFTAITRTLKEVQKVLDDAKESGGFSGVDEEARQEIQEVSALLTDTVKEVTSLKLSKDTPGLNNYATVPTYTNGKLTKIEEMDGNVSKKATVLGYDSNGLLKTVRESIQGGGTEMTLNYINGAVSVSKQSWLAKTLTLKGSDFYGLVTTNTANDYATFYLPTDAVPGTTGIDYVARLYDSNGTERREITADQRNTADGIGGFYWSTQSVSVVFEKGKYDNLAAARAALDGLVVQYKTK